MRKIIKSKVKANNNFKVFSYKGVFILLVFISIGVVVVLPLLNSLGINQRWSYILATSIVGSLGVVYVRNFIDQTRGWHKNILLELVGIMLFLAFMAYIWL